MRRLILSLFVLAGIATQAQTTLWLFGSHTSILFDPTVGPDGSSYYATVDNKIAAVSSTGVHRWSVDLGGQALTPIALQGNLIYVGTSAQQVRAYSLDGHLVWKINLSKNIGTPIAVGGDNSLYFANSEGDLYGVDGNSGTVRWKFYVDTQVGPPVVAQDGTVFVVSNAWMNAVNPTTGKIIWREDVFNFSRVPVVIDSYGNFVYIRQGILDVYDYRGNFLWEAVDETGAVIDAMKVQPVVYGDLLLVAVGTGGDMYAFNSQTGAIVWQFSKVNTTNPIKLTPSFVASIAVDSDGEAYFCDGSGLIGWLNASTGWFDGFQPSNGLGGDVALVGMGPTGMAVIRCGTGNKQLVGIKVPSGPGGPFSQGGGSAYHQARRDDPPYLTLLSPTDGEVISGLFNASASASDDFHLVDISLYLERSLLAKSSSSGVAFSADSGMFQDGVYTVTAIARDSGGNQSVAKAQVAFVNDPPVYGLGYPPPVFSWLSNGVDNKYEVDIFLGMTYNTLVTTSATPSRHFVKGTTWTPPAKKWAKVQDAARASADSQVVFLWRVTGKSGGEVVTRSFIIDKTK